MDNWIISILENAINGWNEKLTEIWMLVSQSPQNFKGGDIWNVISGINDALQGVGYGLLILFFAMGVFQSAASFRELQRPEMALRFFIRFLGAKVAVGYAMDIMLAISDISRGIIAAAVSSLGETVAFAAELPETMKTAVDSLGFLESIPLWLVSLLGSLIVTVLSFTMILTVYGRFFRIYIYTALAPIPLASFAGEGTSASGKAFLKSFTGVCMEGAVVVLACLIYSAFIGSDAPAVDEALSPLSMVWQYIGQMIFQMLVLSGLVRGTSQTVREMLG